MNALRKQAQGSIRQAPARRRAEAGFTLAEVLVAVTVMAVVFVVVFSLYDNLQKSFKVSENAATQQQNTRVAFDRMVADIRMAGFNHNPDGDTARPDEQIEGMWDQAVTVRGDFDFEDATDSATPESTLGGATATFNIVSIGNDEIVTYALGNPAGTGGTSISFVADVAGVPRDGTQETVSISNVHLTQSSAPYTLYRYIVSPNSTNVVKQPVADNIKSLEFTYYDAAGNVLTAVGGAEDPNSLAQREKISKIGIKVVGMTQDPDLSYVDPTEPTSPTAHYRKFTLETDVTPRNIGYMGAVDIDLDDPNAPANFTACQGHCEGTLLKWDHPGDPDIASYTASWGTSVANLTNVISTTNESHYVSGITGPHYFAVRSVDFVGNQSGNVILGPSTPNDTTTPAQVTGAAATGDGGGTLSPVNNEVSLTWAGISGNTTNLSCDESPYPIRDLKGYKVFKGATASFDPNTPSQVIDSWDPNAIPFTVNALSDTNIVNCRPYYYKVAGEDLCGISGAVSAVTDGSSMASAPPGPPTAVSAINMGAGIHMVTWNRVNQNSETTPVPIVIDKYKVYRAVVNAGDDPNQATYVPVYSGFASNPASPDYQATSVAPLPSGQSYYYRIAALDDCPSNEGVLSIPDEAEKCTFGGSISMNINPGGSTLLGNQTITLSVSGGVTTQSSQLFIRDYATGNPVYNQVDPTAPYSYVWNASGVPPGQDYEIIGLVTNSAGCTDSVTTVVTTVAPTACCISPVAPLLQPTTGALKNNTVFFDIVNNCGADVRIGGMEIDFTNNAGQNALLDSIEYDIFGSRDQIDFVPNASPIVTVPLSMTGSLDLDASRTAGNEVRLQYDFTQPMLNKIGPNFIGESIRTDFNFTIGSMSAFGRCSITVVTNPLSVVTCDPATDPNCF